MIGDCRPHYSRSLRIANPNTADKAQVIPRHVQRIP